MLIIKRFVIDDLLKDVSRFSKHNLQCLRDTELNQRYHLDMPVPCLILQLHDEFVPLVHFHELRVVWLEQFLMQEVQ